MAISKNTRDFLDSLIDYYISEAASYKQIAEEYVPEIDSVIDTAFGIIAGCVYSGFLQAYKNQNQKIFNGMNILNQKLKIKITLTCYMHIFPLT